MTLTLRPATPEDSDTLLCWRNDPLTRAMFVHTEAVSPEDHGRWFASTLTSPDRLLYVAEESGVPVGTVRADRIEGGWELSYTTAPEARGKGIGTRMVKELVARLEGRIVADIKRENRASVRIAEAAGLIFIGEAGGLLHFERPAQGNSTARQRDVVPS